MRELPSGTVTFLFTDIEGSTKLLNELGDAYADALVEHRQVLREAFARRGGVEVDTQGDAFFVAFARGDRVHAGLLWGAIEAEEERAPLGQWALERDRYLTRVLAADDADVTRARDRGRALSLEAALEEALRGGRAASGA